MRILQQFQILCSNLKKLGYFMCNLSDLYDDVTGSSGSHGVIGFHIIIILVYSCYWWFVSECHPHIFIVIRKFCACAVDPNLNIEFEIVAKVLFVYLRYVSIDRIHFKSCRLNKAHVSEFVFVEISWFYTNKLHPVCMI